MLSKPIYAWWAFYINSLDMYISHKKGVCLVFIIAKNVIQIFVFNANSVDPDQTPRSAVSDLDLHCLPMSLLLMLGRNMLRGNLRYTWHRLVNVTFCWFNL